MLKFLRKYSNIRKGRHIITVLTITAALTTILLVNTVTQQLDTSITTTYKNYDTIIGPAGSQIQLLMNSLFYTDEPIGTIDYWEYERLTQDKRIDNIIPIILGGHYGTVQIVGTMGDFLAAYPGAGRLWADLFEVVIGSSVTGLTIGSEFYSETDKKYKVVGVLDKTGTAIDNAIFSDIQTIWEAQAAPLDCDCTIIPEEAEYQQSPSGISMGLDIDPAVDMWNNPLIEDEIANLEDFLEKEAVENVDADCDHIQHNYVLTSVLIRSNSTQEQVQLAYDYNKIAGMQAINPTLVMKSVLSNIDATEAIAVALSAVIISMGILMIINIAVLNINDMKADLKLMRLVGISQGKIETIVYLQAFMISILSIALSLALSRVLVPFTNTLLPDMGIMLTPVWLTPDDLMFSGTALIVSMLPIIVLTKFVLVGSLINEKE